MCTLYDITHQFTYKDARIPDANARPKKIGVVFRLSFLLFACTTRIRFCFLSFVFEPPSTPETVSANFVLLERPPFCVFLSRRSLRLFFFFFFFFFLYFDLHTCPHHRGLRLDRTPICI